ncbi:unnamed protein product [Linum tenue]|uniref:Uncharacterized protein n=1 Tax=Linum tenue TaxID=586396 RepID=A0AAV0PYV1_9ROSI|nr:unnamed protein product [Linum tenue]
MAAEAPAPASTGKGKPPEVAGGVRRSAEVSSSTNGKNAKESTQAKKRPRATAQAPEVVELPELPIEFINKEAVMRIAAAIGKPIRVDRATELGARGKFGRVCVEVDLTRPLLSQYKIEGVTYIIQYEGLDKVCTDCGKYGQSTDLCSCHDMTGEKDNMGEEAPTSPTQDLTKGKTYGDWMVVQRKGWT